MAGNIKCIIVDDDEMSIKILEALVRKTDVLDLQGSFTNSIEAASKLRDQEVDLIFLDMEMPNMSGLDLIKTLDRKPQIIIISSREKYAIDAFAYDVTDYLLKPLMDYSRFLKAVLKVKDNLTKEAATKDNSNSSVFIKVDSVLVNFDLTSILWVEAYGDYIKICTEDGKNHVVYSTLKNIEDKLPADDFIRIHRSYIVRLDKIKNIDLTNLQVKDKILPISNTYKNNLLKRIKTL
ncbi:MAG: LytTR family DNA-binding domain-containing protein [Bacteroidota bacterium]